MHLNQGETSSAIQQLMYSIGPCLAYETHSFLPVFALRLLYFSQDVCCWSPAFLMHPKKIHCMKKDFSWKQLCMFEDTLRTLELPETSLTGPCAESSSRMHYRDESDFARMRSNL